MATFYRTVITIEVLSEGPFDPETWGDIVYEVIEGSCSGKWEITEVEEVDADKMAKLLRQQGSEPGFFGLTEDGENDDKCKRCGTPLNEDEYCEDETCPYSDHLQDDTWIDG